MPTQTFPVNRRRIVKGVAWAAPAAIAITSTPAFAHSECIDIVNRHRVEMEVEILTDTWPGYECHNGSWYGGAATSPNPTNFEPHRHYPLEEPIKGRASLTVPGPDPVPAGARFRARTGLNGEIYNSEITEVGGTASGKFSGPEPLDLLNISWAQEWTSTEELQPGDTFVVEWILNFPEAADNSGGTHLSSEFFWPRDECGGSAPSLYASHRSEPQTATPENRTVRRSFHVRYVNPGRYDAQHCA